MTKETVLTKNVFGEDQEFQSLFYCDKHSADMIECSDNILDAMQEFADQSSKEKDERIKHLEEVLRELRDLKDMKDLLEADNFSHIGDYNFCKSEYEKREPLAWKAARTALKGGK